MPSDAVAVTPDLRLIHTILAAQAAALQERIAGSDLCARLVNCAEMLAVLSAHPSPDESAAARRLETALDELAFHHAQHQDLTRQTAGLVARALNILATGEADQPPALSLTGLTALYVSDDQRRLHDAVIADRSARHETEAPPTSPNALG